MKVNRRIAWISLYLLSIACSSTRAQSEKLQRLEATAAEVPAAAGETPLRLSLASLMKAYNTPGMSIAVIEKYKIVGAKGYGVIEVGSNTPVTTHTLYQAGSISKPVAATGVLCLVEQGKLLLDEDVNQKLKTWKVPENDFTKTEKVTLRRLMSHTAGITVHGFPGYDADDPLPTLVQVLNGENPANTDPIRVDTVPGTQFLYSGGGVTIEQLLVTIQKFSIPAKTMRSIFSLNCLEGPKTNSEFGRKRRQIRARQFPFPLANGAEITIGFSFFSRPPQSPGLSSPRSLERCWLSAAIIARPGNGQDLPLPINFAHLPVFDA